MSRGRPLSFDPEQALDRVAEVFRERGFDGASLQSLLSASGLSKSSLYQQYGSKRQLFDQCLDHYARRILDEMRRGLAQAPGGREFIAAVLHRLISEPAAQQGCLVFNTARELAMLDQAMANTVHGVFIEIRSVLIQAIEQDQAAGRMPVGVPAVDLANTLMAAMEGLRILRKGGMSEAELRRSCQVVLRMLD